MLGIYSEPNYLKEHRKIIFSKFNFLKSEYGKHVELEAIVNEDESRLSAKLYKPNGELHLNVELYGVNKCSVELYVPHFRGANKKYLFKETGMIEEVNKFINLCLMLVTVY